MIVVTIIGIVAAIAYPSYQGVIADGYRGTGQADLLALAAAMERHHSGSFSYEGQRAAAVTQVHQRFLLLTHHRQSLLLTSAMT